MLNNLPAMQGTWVQSLGWENPLNKGTATHSSILAGKIPQRSLAGYSPWGCQESDTTERLSLHFSGHCHSMCTAKKQLLSENSNIPGLGTHIDPGSPPPNS